MKGEQKWQVSLLGRSIRNPYAILSALSFPTCSDGACYFSINSRVRILCAEALAYKLQCVAWVRNTCHLNPLIFRVVYQSKKKKKLTCHRCHFTFIWLITYPPHLIMILGRDKIFVWFCQHVLSFAFPTRAVSLIIRDSVNIQGTWLFTIFFLYQSIVEWQCCVSFRCTAKWFSYTCTYIYFFQVIFQFRLLPNIKHFCSITQ